MAAASISSFGASTVGAVQWTLLGIQLLVLASVVAWLGRETRLGRLVRQRVRWLRRRGGVSGEGTLEVVGQARRARLVSMGGGGAPAATPPRRAEAPPVTPARPLRPHGAGRTPARPADAVVARGAPAPATLHCPGCGALLARGELALRLVMRCPGCERRVAVRRDGERIVVTLER